ncbi:MAG: ATP-dependent DNA helicase [Gammaproteobacteria bacterium]
MQGDAEIFSPSGMLAESFPGFNHRQAQQDMAALVNELLAGNGHLVIEAGTGIGKTFAYLIPVLLSGKRAIISTSTRTLQDQLFDRDLPMLSAAVGRPTEVSVLKGRKNYLCWHRTEMLRTGGSTDAKVIKSLAQVTQWAKVTKSGELAELESLPEDSAFRGSITSTADNCLGASCGYYDDCFLVKARRRAQAARVVIVNHHLLLADLSLKETGFGELLPAADVVIVDEAHHFPDVAEQFFDISLGSRELQRLARDVFGEARAKGLTRELELETEKLIRITADTRLKAGDRIGRLSWADCPEPLKIGVSDWHATLQTLGQTLEAVREVSSGLERCCERVKDAILRIKALESAGTEVSLRWIEIQPRSLTLHRTPINSGGALGERIRAQGGSWVFASATLAVAKDFSHFLSRIGVPDAHTSVLPSPFDYEHNARLYLPQGLPIPAEVDFIPQMLSEVWPVVEVAGGGAFLLFTSFRALNEAHVWLESGPKFSFPLLVQGQGSRTWLLDRFRNSGDAVLLGTSSFWQGVDVRGPALRLVVIDKLPFDAPGDPLVQARLDGIRRKGGDPFKEFQLPSAVLALKQGVGRLIRDFHDRGLVVLCDPRLRSRSYGRTFLESLPPMPILETAKEALDFAAGLAPTKRDSHCRATLP